MYFIVTIFLLCNTNYYLNILFFVLCFLNNIFLIYLHNNFKIYKYIDFDYFDQVGPLTTIYQTHCLCQNPSTFTSGWTEMFNTLDFDYLFANIDFEKNPTLYATEITICAIFIIIFILARRKDIKDFKKVILIY